MRLAIRIGTGVLTVIASGFTLWALTNPKFVGQKIAGIFQRAKIGFAG